MEVREPSAKYLSTVQRSELGEFPFDWKVATLGSFEPFITSGSRGWAAYYADIGSTFLRITNLSRTCIYPSLKDLRCVAVPPTNSEGVRTALKAGDILISITADIGIVGLVTEEIELPAYINQHIALVRFAAEDVNSRYLAYFLAGTAAQRRFKSMTDAGAKAGMNLAGVREVLAVLPPSSNEQAAIASALTDADALIDSLEQLLTKKRHIKQGAMQELLTGKRRLPGFTEVWSHDQLSNLVDTPVTDGPHMTPVFVDSGVPFLSVNNIVGNRIDLTDLRFITKADDLLFSKKCKPQTGDILLGKAASVGKVAIVEDDLDFNIWSPIAMIRSGEKLNAKFLYYQLQSCSIRTQISVLTNSSSQGNLGMGDIEKLSISYPTIEEQIRVAAVLSDMDTEITALEDRLTKARALKQAMAQALLTGRIRLMEPSA
jgi:type I restriction enzyme S subunit